jgi:hypothetical protein
MTTARTPKIIPEKHKAFMMEVAVSGGADQFLWSIKYNQSQISYTTIDREQFR